eukprot:389225-Amphidinium_carterae.1
MWKVVAQNCALKQFYSPKFRPLELRFWESWLKVCCLGAVIVGLIHLLGEPIPHQFLAQTLLPPLQDESKVRSKH